MKKTAAGSAAAVTVLVLALFWVQKPWEWKGFLGGVRKEDFVCKSGTYTTEIISIDPPLIYINNFVDDGERKGLIAEGFVFSPSSIFYPLGLFPLYPYWQMELTEVSSQCPQPREIGSPPPRLEEPIRRTHLLIRRPLPFLSSSAMHPLPRPLLHGLLPFQRRLRHATTSALRKGEKFDTSVTTGMASLNQFEVLTGGGSIAWRASLFIWKEGGWV
jgi:hypothetical protein